MTWDAERSRLGRKPVVIVEIDLDYCANTFGVAPCTATGTPKCFNTYGTCIDRPNFSKTSKTYRFSDTLMNGYVPCVQSVTHAPTKIDPAKGLGNRASVSIVLQDLTHNDVGIDPYITERGYKALRQGTFFGRLLARNRYYQGRTLRIMSGYTVDGTFDAANFKTSAFVIDRIDGPDAKGKVTITAKDPLKLADDDRAVCPRPTTGALTSTIPDTGGSTFTVTTGKGSEYNASGFVAIGNEIIAYTRSGDTFTMTARAQGGTVEEAHEIDDAVQECYAVTTPTMVHDIISDLLLNYANVPAAYVDSAAWDTEANVWLLDATFQGFIPKPTGVNKLVTELAQHGTCYLWWDEQEQKIPLRAIRPAYYGEVKSLDDFSGFLQDATSVTEKPDERVSQVWVYYGIRNPFDVEKEENYSGLNVTADLDAEGSFQYGEQRIRKFMSRWIPVTLTTQPGLIGLRYLDKYRDNPRYLRAQIDAKDADIRPGDTVRVSTKSIQTTTGETASLNMQVMEAKEIVSGTKFELLLTDTYFLGRYAYFTVEDAPVFEAATEAQKATMGFFTDEDGEMSDDTEGYKFV